MLSSAAGTTSFSLAVSEEVAVWESVVLLSYSMMVERWLKPFGGSLGESVATDAGFDLDLWLCLTDC